MRPPSPEDGHAVRFRLGSDVVGVDRVRRLIDELPEALSRVFSARELDYSRGSRQAEHLAGRFAAKEAVLKAFGTGLGPRMRWTDVEVVNSRKGRPRVELHGAVASAAHSGGLRQLDISISHTAGIAMAQALAVLVPSPSGQPG